MYVCDVRKLRILAFALAACLAPLLTGCAEDEYDQRDAAYPPLPADVGYTHSPPQVAQGTPPPPTYVPQQVQVQPQDDVQIGADAPDGVDQPPAAEAGYGPDDQYADTDPSALSDFHSALDPYGQWVDDPTYGTVWVPSQDVVGSDFAPYQTAGSWSYDDGSYTWVSDYDWGWAPFHYGRWVYATPVGWAWIPGRVYSGAWVSWRYGYGDWPYVGWGPMAPTWGWRNGVAFGLGFVPQTPYGFCASADLFQPNIHERMVGGGQATTIAQHTRPYTPANPTVNGRTVANPRVNGPSPQALGIPASLIAHGGTANRGVMQARAFAHPSSAVAMGARAPRGYASSSMGRSAYGRPADSHFGGKLGYGFRGSYLNQGPRSAYSLGSRPYYGASPASRGMYGGGMGGMNGYRGMPGGFGMRPGVAPAQSSSGHHYSSEEGSGGGYHGGGFHGGGRGGGGHGGGGGRR